MRKKQQHDIYDNDKINIENKPNMVSTIMSHGFNENETKYFKPDFEDFNEYINNKENNINKTGILRNKTDLKEEDNIN